MRSWTDCPTNWMMKSPEIGPAAAAIATILDLIPTRLAAAPSKTEYSLVAVAHDWADVVGDCENALPYRQLLYQMDTAAGHGPLPTCL